MSCSFKHDNIEILFGVPPTPIDQLPTVCSCGAPITYADTVAFMSAPEMHVEGDTLVIERTFVPAYSMSWLHLQMDLPS